MLTQKEGPYIWTQKKRWNANTASGKVKNVAAMIERHHQKAKKTWRDEMRYKKRKILCFCYHQLLPTLMKN